MCNGSAYTVVITVYAMEACVKLAAVLVPMVTLGSSKMEKMEYFGG